MITFYRKEGRRYIPVLYHDADFDNAFPAGTHMVVVQPGQQSRIFNIQPDAAPLLAALKLAEEDVMRVLCEESTARPDREMLNDRQIQAYERFKTAMGDDICLLKYPSRRQVYDKLVEKLIALCQKT